jgi:chromate reductase
VLWFAAANMSQPIKLLLICGSLRAGSSHAAVLNTALQLAPAGTLLSLYTGLAELPHFNPDDDRQPLPPSAASLRALLAATDAVLFSTPEYAGSLPGSFKNLLDWTVGEGLYRKPVAFINTAPNGGAQGAHDTLRKVLGYVSADVIEGACAHIPVRRDALGPEGLIHDAEILERLRAVLSAIIEHIRTQPAGERDV